MYIFVYIDVNIYTFRVDMDAKIMEPCNICFYGKQNLIEIYCEILGRSDSTIICNIRIYNIAIYKAIICLQFDSSIKLNV